MDKYHTIIVGAGAAGLHCAAGCQVAGRTLIIDHAKSPGEKIRISGGGRCNFTNLHTSAGNFLSQNPHFAKSALAGYTVHDFIDLVGKYDIAFHEKTLGQLFCDGSAKEIIQMLLAEAAGSELLLQTSLCDITRNISGFSVVLSGGKRLECRNLVIASGGKSIPKIGASAFGYRVAEQFGLPLVPTRPGLVPLTFSQTDMDLLRPLSGLSISSCVSAQNTSFREALLFTHRGLSGPAILQVSNYWQETTPISVDLMPELRAYDWLREKRRENGRLGLATVLSGLIPKRLAQSLCNEWGLKGNIADLSDTRLAGLAENLHSWQLFPTGSEGYRTAEVTLGGVSTDALDAKTMQSKSTPGLYFIGEVVDVTGWLGGYNFQWAWSSAHAAASAIAHQ